jgi:sugar lactone lactonase YvrE
MSGIVTTGDALVGPGPSVPADALPDGPADVGSPEEEERRRRRLILFFLLLGLTILLIIIAIWYFLFRQPIPLPLPTTIDLPGYTTSIYGSANPIGIAVSPDGSRIYVAETEDQRLVRIFDGAGAPIGTMQPPESTGTDHVPVWLAIDPLSAEIYVSDRPSGQIYVYDQAGVFQRTVALVAPIQGWQPMGIAFDTAGNLYVSDLGGSAARVEMFDRSLNQVRTFGERDQLSFPNGVAVDADGNVFVADSNNGRLIAYKPDGTLLTQVGRGTGSGELALPRGVVVDSRNRVYVGDATGQGVLVFRLNQGSAPGLEYLGFFGGEGIADGRFSFPNGVAADTRGRLYVTDTNNDRVQMWSY